ncbi:amino acid deaminase/aldolase [Paenibacillus endoradicis]|uniref:amino acid deaminase/aldolase n=1 Tax=Paenibacillus endoradicis TaxID=2972487 RepID=UPI002158ACFA|nr:amino acid deaminase/aldolase [Paenibacillus endoradicis]MCR8657784.1 amino acid deaminase/aldolase [Paenibacillus endoradicis]
MLSPQYEQYKQTFKSIEKPFAYINLDLLDANMKAISLAAGSKKIRVATKSIRSVEILNRIMNADQVFQGLMCFTVKEATFLLKHGFDDILLGYPAWDEKDITSLILQAGDNKLVTFMVDSLHHVEQLQKIADQCKCQVRICLDIDMSVKYPFLHFGVRRSPIVSWEMTKPIVERIIQCRSLTLVGIMGYEAQIAGVGDQVEGQWLKNQLIKALKRNSIREVARRRAEVLQGISKLGVQLEFVNAGGTGSLDSSCLEEGVSEITVGSGFYSPVLFDSYSNFKYLPAVGYAVEVVRKPMKHIVTCLGGGYTASGAVGADKLPTPHLPYGLKLLLQEGAGEVQTPLRCPKNMHLEIGDPIFFRHAKAGELCERFSKLYAVEGNVIVDEYSTYRGEGECFL